MAVHLAALSEFIPIQVSLPKKLYIYILIDSCVKTKNIIVCNFKKICAVSKPVCCRIANEIRGSRYKALECASFNVYIAQCASYACDRVVDSMKVSSYYFILVDYLDSLKYDTFYESMTRIFWVVVMLG